MSEEFSTGYKCKQLTWDGGVVTWANRSITMTDTGPKAAPDGVKEYRVLEPILSDLNWLNGALITLEPSTSTPVQRFSFPRQFVEQPFEGVGIWIGVTPDRASVVYIPETAYSISTHKREGSLSYEQYWTGCWVNMGQTDFRYIKLCMPPFEEDKTIEVLQPDAQDGAPMFWGLWRLLVEESHSQT